MVCGYFYITAHQESPVSTPKLYLPRLSHHSRFFLVMKKKSGEVFGLPFRVCALCDLSKVLRETFCPKCFLSCVVVILSFIVSKHGFKGSFRLSSSVLSYVTFVYS